MSSNIPDPSSSGEFHPGDTVEGPATRLTHDALSGGTIQVGVASAEILNATIYLSQVTEDAAGTERWIQLVFAWAGKTFELEIAESDRVYDLKAALHSLTEVPPERQKILGLVKGKLPPDQARVLVRNIPFVADLKLVPGKKFNLVGTPQGSEIKDPSQLEFLPDVLNDLDVDFSKNLAAAAAYKNDKRNIRKVKEATEKLKIDIITPLREGKKLLVLDIDYTILDTKPLTSGALPPAECARPGLHEFLEGMYALSIIWNHFPQCSAKNTIHVDDLSRNFALNPKEGLKIHAFKDAHTPAATQDRELEKLTRYMVHIASVDDFRILQHNEWKNVLRDLRPHRQN
ncbi:hypothetical protein HWV62_26296 [Athelia sp. TMB]|nr:hypothetical protein HWV62_26296 [Athelia sp. TMB]